jgi:cell division septation protein DedD
MKSQDQEENKLHDELETMYRRVAESEKSESDSPQMEALQSYYEALQVSPDASMEKIKETYERLVDFWNPSQYADNLPLREKAERKLTEITHAFEKIVAFRQRESGAISAEPTMEISMDPNLSAPYEETGHPLPWGKILLGGGVFVVGVLAVSFWPTLYHYDRIPSGDKTYQVRTNRITGGMTYFDQGQWNKLPLPVAKSSAPPPLPAVAPPAPPPALPAKEPIAAPPTKPGPKEGPKVASKKEAPSEKPASQTAETQGYAIQVSAMRDLNMAKEFVQTQKKSGQKVYLAKIKIKNRGVWYRVYLGHFANKGEATRYLKEKKIEEFFPECFIRKLSG